jgi:hypothetical protein
MKKERKWCKTRTSEHGISYFKLLVDEDYFNLNIVWFIGIEIPKGGAIYWEKYYAMNDGTIIQIGRLAYSPDSWCVEYPYEEGLTKILESIKARGYKIYHITENIPEIIQKKLPTTRVVKEQLPTNK